PADCPTCVGGVARRHTLVRSIRLSQNPMVLLENGDLTQGAGAENELTFQTAILAMNEMGYDAFNIGEIDVTLGARFLTNLAERAEFPFISANLAGSDGQRLFPAYTVMERVIGGKKIRVAVIGVMSDDVGDYLAAQHGLDVKVLDAERTLATALYRLKDKADLRILLAHAGPQEALSWTEAHPEIDMTVYSHEADRPVKHEKSTEEQIVVNAGNGGQYLARTDIVLDESGGFSHNYETLTLSDKVPDSPVVRKILDCSMRMMVEQGFSKRTLTKQPERGGYYLGSEGCSECHLEQFNIWSENRHSKAFAPLENEGKQSDPACLPCHVTGYRFFTGFESLSETPDLASVGCEVCHGVGSNHAENPTKRYGRTSRRDCKSCHDKQNSPRFDYNSYYEKMAHENG
ncbi:MAG: hypothetical protein KAJ01_02785, partial [Candidatus Hydrogenedentes bacterium]|nr:hypothetical protein [Candidatus Hydrogenedentota bacterium]